ncbi:MAG TPA: hypothetical protein VIM93_09560 [Kangiella sp.]
MVSAFEAAELLVADFQSIGFEDHCFVSDTAAQAAAIASGYFEAKAIDSHCAEKPQPAPPQMAANPWLDRCVHNLENCD